MMYNSKLLTSIFLIPSSVTLLLVVPFDERSVHGQIGVDGAFEDFGDDALLRALEVALDPVTTVIDSVTTSVDLRVQINIPVSYTHLTLPTKA